MPQETTLLAYLVPRLTSSVEDSATDALAFIPNKSPACRDALSLLLREGGGALPARRAGQLRHPGDVQGRVSPGHGGL